MRQRKGYDMNHLMSVKSIPAVLLLLISSWTTACRTTGETSSSLLSSSARDDRVIENILKNYSFEFQDIDAFSSKVDWADYFEDVETHQRTNFAVYASGKGTQCTVGLTADQIAFLKTHSKLMLGAYASAPGRTNDVHHSQIFFTYQNDKTKLREEFLVSCNQPNRRLAMADLAATLADFIKIRSLATDNPKYDVCCQCSNNVYATRRSGNDEIIVRGATAYFVMAQSNDNVCRDNLSGRRYNLRPGDQSFSPNEERYQVWTNCDEANATSCNLSSGAPKKTTTP